MLVLLVAHMFMSNIIVMSVGKTYAIVISVQVHDILRYTFSSHAVPIFPIEWNHLQRHGGRLLVYRIATIRQDLQANRRLEYFYVIRKQVNW